MMKTKFLAWGGMLFALCAMLTVTSCSKDDATGGDVPAFDPTAPVTPSSLKFAAFSGVVREAYSYGDGNPISVVTVTSGDQTTKTDINGYYKLDKVNVVNGRAVLKFQKKGYMSVVRSVPVQETMRLDVAMKANTTSSFSSTTSMTISMSAGYSQNMNVELPANGYVTEAGTAYTGTVNASSVYLDPDDRSFANQMPGDLTAIRTDNSEAQLVSWGMVAVELTGENGEKLNLAEGKAAKVTFPIPDKFKGGTLPATIPLWSFNEATGLWEEEGVATLNGAGDAYEGEVSHFSWHNLDSPDMKATINVTVKDSKGNPLAFVPIDIDGQRTFYTDKDGKMKCDIPSNVELYVRISSEAYGNYTNGDSSKEQKQTIKLDGGETRDINFTIPAAPVITGVVTNTGVGSKICKVCVWYLVTDGYMGAWQNTSWTMTDINGAFLTYGPAGFTGEAKLVAVFNDGTRFEQPFTLTGEDQRVDMTVTSSASAGSGIVTVWNDEAGIRASYPLPAPKEGSYWETVTIGSGYFNAFLGEDKDHHHSMDGSMSETVNFYIQTYDATKTHFEGAYFSFYKEGHGPHFGINANGPADVTVENGIYTIKMENVMGRYDDQMLEYDGPVNISVEFSAKLAPEVE